MKIRYIFAGALMLATGLFSFANGAYASGGTVSTSMSQINGEFRLLVVPVDFLSSGTVETRPFTHFKAHENIMSGSVSNFYNEQSYGKVVLSGRTLPWTRLERTANPGKACEMVRNDEISSILTQNGVDLIQYDGIVLLVSNPGAYGGCTSVGKIPVGNLGSIVVAHVTAPLEWRTRDGANFVLVHEIGHVMGLSHANGWDCGTDIYKGNCREVEYGNYFDTMGRAELAQHFNAKIKADLGWIPSTDVVNIASSGDYSLFPLEGISGVRMLRLPIGQTGDSLVFEYRNGEGIDSVLTSPIFAPMTNGVIAYLERNGESLLLDMTPTSNPWPVDMEDSSLQVGTSFRIESEGIEISNIRKISNSIVLSVKIPHTKEVLAVETPVVVTPVVEVKPVIVTEVSTPVVTPVVTATVVETTIQPIATLTFDDSSNSLSENNGSVSWLRNGNINNSAKGSDLELSGDGALFLSREASEVFAKTNNRSVSLWFKADNLNSYKTLFDKGVTEKTREFSFWIDGEDRGWMAVGGSAGQAWSSRGFTKNVWHHFVMTQTGTQITVYLDGEKKFTKNVPTNFIGNNGLFAFGGNPTTGGTGWVGGLDNIEVYAQSLNDSEVSALSRVIRNDEQKVVEVTPIVSQIVVETAKVSPVVVETETVLPEPVVEVIPEISEPIEVVTAKPLENTVKQEVEVVPAKSDTPNVEIIQPESPKSSAVVLDADRDYAGVWYMFQPGKGKLTNISNDWHWKLNIQLSEKSIIDSISVKNPGLREEWSTGNVNAYPLVVLKDGQQVNARYMQWFDTNGLMTLEAGMNTLDVYGQTETLQFGGGIVEIVLKGGEKISLPIAGSLSI